MKRRIFPATNASAQDRPWIHAVGEVYQKEGGMKAVCDTPEAMIGEAPSGLGEFALLR